MDSAQLYHQLCLAAGEYTLFRNQMMVSHATLTAAQMLAALTRADKVMAMLKQLNQREAITFVQSPPPQPQLQPPPQPAPLVQPIQPSVTVWQCTTCNASFQVQGSVPPDTCPQCKRRLR